METHSDTRFFLSALFAADKKALGIVVLLQGESRGKRAITPGEAAEMFFGRGTSDELLWCFLFLLQERHKTVSFLATRANTMSVDEAVCYLLQVRGKQCGWFVYHAARIAFAKAA